MENKYKGVPFWSWNDELDEKELVDQIDWMYKGGIGGFFMHARGGLTTPYLGEKWFSCVEACLKRAKELDMEAYAYDENGWPSGFVGGLLCKDRNNCDCALSYEEGEYDPKALVSYDISGDKLVRVKEGKHVLNIYKHICFSTADILNKDVVKQFIEKTHEQYKKHDIYGNLRGFFTDEPQYQRWNHPYTNCLVDYFKEHYHEDIFDRLGLMFVEKEGYRDFRYKYWLAMQTLMLNSFAKQIYDWCDSNGYKLTGHYVEETSLFTQMWCDAGIMPFYQFEHIPGIDWLGRGIGRNDLAPKQVASVAAQLGKNQILTETYGCAGWDATPEELKHIAEYQFVSGVNLMCAHLLPYKEHGQRKRDYPEHYSAINPWVNKHFKEFNDYFTELGEKIANSKENVNVAVFHPIRSCYFNYKRNNDWKSVSELDDSLNNTINKLGAMHIPYHFADETVMENQKAYVKGNKLVIGLCEYEYLVFPKIYTMGKNSERLISEFIKNGGKVFLFDDVPHYLEGNEFEYSYLKTNTSLEEIVANQEFKMDENPNVRVTYRTYKDGNKFFYIVNLGEKTEVKLNNKKLCLDKWESRLINEEELKDDTKVKFQKIGLANEMEVTSKPNNYLTLDSLRFSFDGENYSDIHPHMAVFDKLLHDRYEGDLYLKYEFDSRYVPHKCLALIEDTNTKEVYINGILVKDHSSILEKDLWTFDIAKYVKVGHNEIVVKIHYFQTEDVYFALFGGGTESLRNCLVYKTTLEAIYLQGDFGVYGDIKKGHQDNTYIGENFYLDEQKKVVSSLIEDGFPFLRGAIELKQHFTVDDDKVELEIPERFQTVDVEVNGKYVGLMMFKHQIDISKFVHKGDNELKITATISNRNLLGTFHNAYTDEEISVGPGSFERFGFWKDLKCEAYRDNYSFVKNLF